MESNLGFMHFIQSIDGISKFLFILLITMSVMTWFLILTKSIKNYQIRQQANKFLKKFWASTDLSEVQKHLTNIKVTDPFSILTIQGLHAVSHHNVKSEKRLLDSGSSEEFLTRALRRTIDHETARLESGLTMLASIGSSAPFVGLFGTVWGVYHALISISASGQDTLDKISGPVGEALIMTALGLAVAIPAVLAYNFFNRANRLLLNEIDGFAHDLFAFMTTGARGDEVHTLSSPMGNMPSGLAAKAGVA